MNYVLVYKNGMMISGKMTHETKRYFHFKSAEGTTLRLKKEEQGSRYTLSKSLLQSHSFLETPLYLEERELTTQVSEAIEAVGPMPVGKWVQLEYLDKDMDGVFKDEKEWKAFLDKVHDSCDNDVMDELLKNYCAEQKEYKHLFVQPIGGGRYMSVKAEDLTLYYRAEPLWKKFDDNPSAVEILVRADIK